MKAKVVFEGDLLEILRQFRFDERNISDVLNQMAELPENKYLHFSLRHSDICCEIRKA